MKILAFDTSTKYLSIACLEGRDVKAEFHEDVGIRHSSILVATIDKVLRDAGWTISGIDLICVGLGPGSFTGLRIAAATVKGIAAVAGNKVIGVPTMDAIALNTPEGIEVSAPFLDARKNKVYSCLYKRTENGMRKTTDYLLVTVEELLSGLEEKVFFFGDAVGKYRERLELCPFAVYEEDMDWYPRASEIGRLGLEAAQGGTDDPERLEPLYLHEKECNITSKK